MGERFYDRNWDWSRDDLASQYDEISVWSAPFAKLLLDNVPLRKISSYLDVGCGTGFPLIDIAQRIGNDCIAVGIDPWQAAIDRCNAKMESIGCSNIKTICATFESASFQEASFDLITSNLGVNNFSDSDLFFKKAREWLRPHGTLAITSNLMGSFAEFYRIYVDTASDLGIPLDPHKYSDHIHHRGTEDALKEQISRSGLALRKLIRSSFCLRFSNGTAFLNHSVISSGFMGAWKELIPPQDRPLFFDALEKRINEASSALGEFSVSIPAVYVECMPEG